MKQDVTVSDYPRYDSPFVRLVNKGYSDLHHCLELRKKSAYQEKEKHLNAIKSDIIN